MLIAWCSHKATNTHSVYVKLTELPPQQLLKKCVSVLCDMYIALLVLPSYKQVYLPT